jgi:hypothetical protein
LSFAEFAGFDQNTQTRSRYCLRKIKERISMGAIFKLKHANIMAYVTSNSYAAPRVRRRDLTEFLDSLKYDARRYLISEDQSNQWSDEIADVASRASIRFRDISYEGFNLGNGRASSRVQTSNSDEETISSAIVENVLGELRSELSSYALFALAVGSGRDLKKTVIDLAKARMYGQLLVLIPEEELSDRNFEVLDPIPAFSTALHAAAYWPGIVFWTANGESAFAPLEKVEELRFAIQRSLDRDHSVNFSGFRMINGNFDAILRDWKYYWKKYGSSKSRRLLHLSDLHFGTDDATMNQPLLNAELRDVVKSVDRVVITGDLFDTPNKNYATLFQNFRDNITHLAGGREPISITGNHDQRMIGLFGDNYKQVASIGSTKIIVDEKCEMIFICFNSSVKGSLARGKITSPQFRQLGAEYRTLIAANPALKKYLPIVLVHHHPFSFDVQPETWVQRALSAVGLRDESFLEMVDAAELHRWCLDWKIKTILHGHKHKARYLERQIIHNGEKMSLTAIGCGSSLGAEGSAISYNMLEWEPQSQRWVASFFESVNGGAFREIVVSVSP